MVICSLDALKENKVEEQRNGNEEGNRLRCYNKLVTVKRVRQIKRSE